MWETRKGLANLMAAEREKERERERERETERESALLTEAVYQSPLLYL